MRSRFWQKPGVAGPSVPPSLADWPTEACDSLRSLAALHTRDAYPFTDWYDPQFPVERDLQSLFHKHVKVHRLHVWFSMYVMRRGEVEAAMLRDTPPHWMEEITCCGLIRIRRSSPLASFLKVKDVPWPCVWKRRATIPRTPSLQWSRLFNASTLQSCLVGSGRRPWARVSVICNVGAIMRYSRQHDAL